MFLKFFTHKSPLHNAIRSNAIFCDLSGLAMVLFSKPIASMLGLSTGTPLLVIGVGLFFWAIFLAYIVIKSDIPKWQAWLAIGGDLLWVVASIVILFTDFVSFSLTGKWIIAILADIVLVFAIWQFWTLKKQ